MDAKDEWHELEDKFDHFKAKMDKASDVAGDSLEEVKAGLGILSDELKSCYQKIKNIMKTLNILL